MSDGERQLARFGLYEADLRQRVLTRSGLRIRVQDQPFQVLALLLERCGEIVTRDEIRQALWPADSYVEFDDSLNTAIKKLRMALGDTAHNPRFIETIPRRGYRFVAPTIVQSGLQIAMDRGAVQGNGARRTGRSPRTSNIL
jgi:DNA-binding winged helix-turn-helix (wHTH) protein